MTAAEGDRVRCDQKRGGATVGTVAEVRGDMTAVVWPGYSEATWMLTADLRPAVRRSRLADKLDDLWVFVVTVWEDVTTRPRI